MATLSSILNTKAGISPSLFPMQEVTDGTRGPFQIPSISSLIYRNQNPVNNWSANDVTGAGVYAYISGNTAPSCEAWFASALGGHGRGVTNPNWTHYSTDSWYSNNLEFASQGTLGGYGWLSMYPNYSGGVSYGPVTCRLMFLRNHHPSTSQSISLTTSTSSYWSSGYDGTGIAVGQQNAATYSGTTGLTWTNLLNRTGASSWTYNDSFTITIPAQRSAVLLVASTAYYYTTNGPYWWWQNNMFYNLQAWGNNWIQPDMRLTMAANIGNDTTAYAANKSHLVWQRAAQMFGDR